MNHTLTPRSTATRRSQTSVRPNRRPTSTADPRRRRIRDPCQNARSDREHPDRSSAATPNARRAAGARTRNRRSVPDHRHQASRQIRAFCVDSGTPLSLPATQIPSDPPGQTARSERTSPAVRALQNAIASSGRSVRGWQYHQAERSHSPRTSTRPRHRGTARPSESAATPTSQRLPEPRKQSADRGGQPVDDALLLRLGDDL